MKTKTKIIMLSLHPSSVTAKSPARISGWRGALARAAGKDERLATGDPKVIPVKYVHRQLAQNQ